MVRREARNEQQYGSDIVTGRGGTLVRLSGPATGDYGGK
jgi:hypothetical protein